ncbi:hypothetical protein [Serratia rubidaea]|uniref:Uncharacterized protein n=1 Tax=Serratia rubidaea TaxID=61652 RepID=A0A448SWK4_SERRU|nr:hypothetical protein [Serratia rubidaea]MDC6119676.1 hypothetical protein [Serratia rubidaea]VEI71983.1 Uncharacterised protein [Serratia rubidaea]
MGWPIPDIPEKTRMPAPHFRLWAGVLLIMLIAGSLLALFIGRVDSYIQMLIYGTLPAFLLWLSIFGVVLNRYDQSGVSAFAWHEESRKTKSQWRQWSRRQVAVIGNVLLTPEADGVASMLGAAADIPMFPKKARPLWGEEQNLTARCNMIDKRLEEQAAGYRHDLYAIYVLCPPPQREEVADAVLRHWDLMPEFVDAIEQVPPFNVDAEITGIALVLCVQCWAGNSAPQYSEFIAAQLIGAPAFIRTRQYRLLAGMGRIMPLSPGRLPDDLDMLFDYNGLDFTALQHVWLSGESEQTAVDVALYAESRQWVLPKKCPFHYVDLTFGPPGEFAFTLSLSMMAEAAAKTSQNQLIIFQQPQSSGWMCLITRELFS